MIPPPPSPARLAIPARPDPPQPYSFPILASVAPVVASIAIWAVTHSVFSLVFAFLGPLIAVASLFDSKFQGRRRAIRERARFAADLTLTHSAIVSEHAREAAAIGRRAPAPSVVLASGQRDPERWRAGLDCELLVTIGRGRVASMLRLDGDSPPPSAGVDSATEDALAQLRAAAATIGDAAVQVDARLGIGVCGPGALAAAVARGIVVQLANALSPAEVELSCPADSSLAALPHRMAATPADGTTIEFRSRSAQPRAVSDTVVVAVSETIDGLSRRCRVVIRVGESTVVVRHPEPDLIGSLRPELVSEEQVRVFAELLHAAAVAEGLCPAGTDLPEVVSFESLPVHQRDGTGSRASLACAVARRAGGILTLDLVADGPHAVIGGTTGSGKSELLISWVLAMAAGHGPDEVNFLLVDFKGGSSFTAVQRLPHSVGLVTDLDASSAGRALASLSAELRYRERALAQAAVREIGELTGDARMPRLVIVVDEFAAMVSDFPDLHQLFVDIAARGRSLGVHLILCTQRPAGVVRDAVLANCALRLSLRVNNRADSVALLGTGAAAQLPRYPLGRGLVSIAGGEAELVQIALAGARDCERIGAAWSPIPLRRPWCEPLPARITAQELPQSTASGMAFGLSDLPDEQRQEAAVFDPDRHGNLIVLGGHGSGKTGVLAAMQSGDSEGLVDWLPTDLEIAWDAMTAYLSAVRSSSAGRRLLLLDDVDVLLGRYPEEYQHAFVELLTSLVRESGGAGVHVVLTAQRLPGGLQGIGALCDSRLILRLPNREEYLLAGGEGDFTPEVPPGGAVWRGHRVQVVAVPGPSSGASGSWVTPVVTLDGQGGCAVISSTPRKFAAGLRERADEFGGVIELAAEPAGNPFDLSVERVGRPTAVVADAETWQSHWGLLARLKTTMPLIFDGCVPAQFRAITGLRTLPPPIAPHSGAVWLLTPDGTVSRARL